MALKPTIYKLKIVLSDLDRNIFDTLQLTVAQHPSETAERMMVRVLAYCINWQPQLEFGKGLSTADEPDIWCKTLDGRTTLWIDAGEPSPERIKKACRVAEQVSIYSFNSKARVWWQQEQAKLADLPAQIYQFDWTGIQQLAGLVQRNMDLTLTLSEQSAYFSSPQQDCEVSWQRLN